MRLKQHPVPELEALRRPILETRARRLSPGVDPLQGIVGTALDIALTVDLEASSATEMRLAVRVGTDESTSIDLNLNDLTLAVDRGHSGRQLPQCSYAEAQLSSVAHRAGTLDLRVLVDSTSVEVFAAGGLVSITQQVLPSRASTRLALYVVGGDAVLTSLEVHELVVEAGRAS